MIDVVQKIRITLKNKRLWRNILQVLLLSLSLFFLILALVRNWTAVQEAAGTLDWGQFFVAVGLLIIALCMLPLPTYLGLRAMQGKPTYSGAFSAFFTSQAVKYLPGGLWAIPGRTVIYRQRYGIDAVQGMFAVLWEVIVVLVAALLVGAFGAPLPDDAPLLPVWLAAVLVILTVAILSSQRAEFWRLLRRAGIKQAADIAARLDDITLIPSRSLFWMTLAAVGFWLLTGLAFYTLVTSLPETAGGIQWPEATGIYALAWLAGFLVFIAPAGLGFREASLTLLLSAWLDPGQAVFMAVLARLWWTLAEAILIGIALILLRTSAPPSMVDTNPVQ